MARQTYWVNALSVLVKVQYYLTHFWEDKGFFKGYYPETKVIAQLEIELVTVSL